MGGVTPAQFESLVNEHKDAVYRQMARVCGHREDAEDALATALMHAFRAADQLADQAAFRSWLGTIGKRVCTRMRQHPRITETLEYAEERGLLRSNLDEMEMQVLKGCVAEAVEGLPDLYRDVYRLCEIEEVTVPEAAKQLGVTEAAAKTRLLRAREKVRATLDRSICAVN